MIKFARTSVELSGHCVKIYWSLLRYKHYGLNQQFPGAFAFSKLKLHPDFFHTNVKCPDRLCFSLENVLVRLLFHTLRLTHKMFLAINFPICGATYVLM